MVDDSCRYAANSLQQGSARFAAFEHPHSTVHMLEVGDRVQQNFILRPDAQSKIPHPKLRATQAGLECAKMRCLSSALPENSSSARIRAPATA